MSSVLGADMVTGWCVRGERPLLSMHVTDRLLREVACCERTTVLVALRSSLLTGNRRWPDE
jgi:hypothetical protein